MSTKSFSQSILEFFADLGESTSGMASYWKFSKQVVKDTSRNLFFDWSGLSDLRVISVLVIIISTFMYMIHRFRKVKRTTSFNSQIVSRKQLLFDGGDFLLWRDQVTTNLQAAGVWEAVDEKFNVNANVRKDTEAKVILMSCIDDKVLRQLLRTSAKEIWRSLNMKYKDKDYQSVIFMKQKLFKSKQKKNESLEDFIDRIRYIRNELAVANQIVSDDVVIAIVHGVLPIYENFVQMLMINKVGMKFEAEDFIRLLKQEEERKKEKRNEKEDEEDDMASEKAFLVKASLSDKTKKCTKCKRSGHYANQCKLRKIEDVTCYNCQEMGHYASNCPLPKRSRPGKSTESVTENHKEEKVNEGHVNFALQLECSPNDTKETWIIDSGASNHFCNTVKMFIVKNDFTSIVKVGDGRELKVRGIGIVELEVELENHTKAKLTLHDVLYVPELNYNLISIGKLSDKGYLSSFHLNFCKIEFKKNFAIKCLKNANNMYELKTKNTIHALISVGIEKDWSLWHYRLGHLGADNMKKIKTSDIEIDHKAEKFCKSCAKSTKLPHPSIDRQNQIEKHVIIHSDLVGPMKIKSVGGKEYILTYLCGTTQYSFVYFIKHKSEQAERFEEFKAHYETLANEKIKELRTDNGREYLSNEFQKYLRENGIIHNTSVEYCPQMNGKAERLNRTLIVKARCMLISAGLASNLWTAAVSTANYLRNRSPSAVLNGRAPYEAMFKTEPRLNHLRIFGCDSYPHELNKISDKFQPVARQNCVMIGYGEKEGIYWVWDKVSRKEFRTRDVKFNEASVLANTINHLSDPVLTLFENDSQDKDADPKALRRSSREPKPVERLGNIVEYDENETEPGSFHEAISCTNRDKWQVAINTELAALEENNTWTPMPLPIGKRAISSKWIFKIKRDSENNIERYKARLVAKGFMQKEGIDYNETFAPVIRKQSLRILLAIAVNENLEIHHIDVITAFLNGDLHEEVYIKPPEGCEFESQQVLKLNKALYGLKQASREWNVKLIKFLKECGFKQLQSENCILYSSTLIVAVYVDDMPVLGRDRQEIEKFKSMVSKKFKVKDLGILKKIVGINIEYLRDGSMLIHQKNYIDKIVSKFNLNECRPIDIPIEPNHKLSLNLEDENDDLRKFISVKVYQQAIGCLIYLMTCTRPDISYSVGILARFMQQPREMHWRYVLRLIKYIKTTREYVLVYQKSNHLKLVGFTDSDYAGDVEERKSTSGYVFKIGECIISWNSSRQKIVSLSSTEAEYISLVSSVKEAIWLKQLVNELEFEQPQITIHCDNKSAICLANNPEFHSRSKHIDVRFHFIREKVSEKTIALKFIPTDEMVADMMTKGLAKIKHLKNMDMLHLEKNPD